MSLGQKLRQARLDAGLSQRQLCEPQITRNMMSRIEHDAVKPSMSTMQFLAQRLGKTVSYFLDEEEQSPNAGENRMAQLRRSFQSGDYASVAARLEQLAAPSWEEGLLLCLSTMKLARQALEKGQHSQARSLLRKSSEAAQMTPYAEPSLQRELILLRSEAGEDPGKLSALLLEDNRELMLRARAAQAAGDPAQAAAYLTAAGQQDSPLWNLLRGESLFTAGEYQQAADCFRKAEEDYPSQCIPRLEACYRELEDYKQAYFYACKQRK